MEDYAAVEQIIDGAADEAGQDVGDKVHGDDLGVGHPAQSPHGGEEQHVINEEGEEGAARKLEQSLVDEDGIPYHPKMAGGILPVLVQRGDGDLGKAETSAGHVGQHAHFVFVAATLHLEHGGNEIRRKGAETRLGLISL